MGFRVSGLGVSPGVAIGSAYRLHTEQLPVVPVPIPPERVEEEISRFERARVDAASELGELRDRVTAELGESYGGILEVQLLILEDPSLVRETVKRIQIGRVAARWALKEVVAEFSRRFAAVDELAAHDPGGDLADVHRRLQRLLVGGPGKSPELPEGPVIVVAQNLVPSDAIVLVDRGVVGLATDFGGHTSHTVILAQALAVPAVAGLHDFSLRVQDGDAIVLDGETGELQHLPSIEETLQAEHRRQRWLAEQQRVVAAAGELPARTRDGIDVTLRANIEFPTEIETAQGFGARGIGLYRSEFLFLSRAPEFPTEEDHYRTYRRLGESTAPEAAVIRTLDLGGEKYFHEMFDARESNPVLGLRGVRLCLQRSDIFRPQLRGLLRAAAHTDLKMMLPLVTTVEEIRAVRELLREEAEALRAEGHEVGVELPLGIMIEVPAAAVAADLLAREADFISIGTNDLFQYALAVDRGNESVAYLYRPRHPGVLRMLRFVVEAAGEAGIPVSICGEMAGDPERIEVLIGLGLREFSMQPRAIPALRQALQRIDSNEARETALELLQQPLAAGGSIGLK